jgi:hypothetical protein
MSARTKSNHPHPWKRTLMHTPLFPRSGIILNQLVGAYFQQYPARVRDAPANGGSTMWDTTHTHIDNGADTLGSSELMSHTPQQRGRGEEPGSEAASTSSPTAASRPFFDVSHFKAPVVPSLSSTLSAASRLPACGGPQFAFKFPPPPALSGVGDDRYAWQPVII